MSGSKAMLAKYACDSCRTRKIRCSREKPQCAQCIPDSRECVYTRQGIIHRQRRTKQSPGHGKTPGSHQTDTNLSNEFESQLEADIHAAEEGLTAIPKHRYTGNLTSLSAEYTSFWQDPSFIEMAARIEAEGNKQFFSFPEQTKSWSQIFEEILTKGSPWFTPVPPEILSDLIAHPERVRQSAYLVIFYGIMLTLAAAEPEAYIEDTVPKLRWNLWLALNDAKLLLEPSDLNIQALLYDNPRPLDRVIDSHKLINPSLLSMHVQDFHTPSLCWMLLTTACRMLQALGITSRSLDQKTRERRLWLFWSLSSMDISLAIMFGRPPTFHRAMREKLPILDVHHLLGYQPHLDTSNPATGRCSLFGAHFMHQLYGMGDILAEIWSCLYDSPSTHRPIEEVKASLDSWYKGALKVLEATQLVEMPLLLAKEKQSLAIGIKFVSFQYHYHCCVLLRSQRKWRADCVKSSRAALRLLDGLVSDSNEVYNGVVWGLLYCPFTPFFVLFGDVLSNGDTASRRLSLEAMHCLPEFMEKMAPRHPQAAKLHHICISLVHQARSVLVDKLETEQTATNEGTNQVVATEKQSQGSGIATADHGPQQSQISEMFDPASFMNYFNESLMPTDPTPSNFWTPNTMSSGTDPNDPTNIDGGTWRYGDNLSDMLMQSNFDWFAWDSNAFGFDNGYNPF